ncbi:hydrolase [Methylobacterium organophilum]|uniref:hydrolase n=1 Tax=Methylobacterium organophilum TaxID=410 RepID=UPI001EE189A8|nr:hydrolase [Methylobacterium organophilum]
MSESPASSAPFRRQVFYLPGFDPRDPETYWGLYRREARFTAGRRGLGITVGEPVRNSDGLSLDWTIRCEAGARQAETRYTLLRWEEIVRSRFPRSNLTRLWAIPALWWRLRRSGYTKAFRKEARRFARVIYGVHQIYAAFVLLAVAAATLLVTGTPLSGGPAALTALLIPLVAYGILGLITRVTKGKPLYIAHLVDDTAFTHDHASGAETRMRDRLGAWAEKIRAAEGQADEIVVIGHSSSSFLAIEALDRLLSTDPDFGRRSTPVTLVTIGSVIPWITLDPRAVEMRAALQRFGAASAIAWLDLRAKWDWLSIHLRDPLQASGLPAAAPGRLVAQHVRIEDLIEPRIVARRRWNLFRMHFQLLMSSCRPDTFDYIAFTAAPEPVHAYVAARRKAGQQGAAQDPEAAIAGV